MASAFRRRFWRKAEPDSPRESLDKEGTLLSNIGPAFKLAPLPDGDRIITSDGEDALYLFSTRTGKCLRTYKGHDWRVHSIVLLGDDIFASVCLEAILVHRISDGTKLDRFEYNESFSTSALVGNGYFLVGTDQGKILEMHCDETSKLTHKRTVVAWTKRDSLLWDYEISVCNNCFAVSNRKHGFVTIVELTSFEHVGNLHVNTLWCIHLTDQVLVTGSSRGTILLYNAQTLDLVREMQMHSDRVSSVHVSADGRFLISSGRDGLVSIYDISTGTQIWQKQFNASVRSTTLLSDGRLATRFSQVGTVVHEIPQDVVQPMLQHLTMPSTPLGDAFETCLSGIELPVQKCNELITFERCRTSFDEWCFAHQLLMMAVEDGDIERSGNYNGEIAWWLENLYMAAKDLEIGSEDEARAMKKFLLQAKATGVVEGIDSLLIAKRLTQDLRKEVRALQRADILMLERVLSIEVRLDKLKEAFNRYRRYMRNSHLLGVALQLIPIAGGSVAGVVSAGADVIEGLSAKDLTDYFLGVGCNLALDEVSSMGERVFCRAADALSEEVMVEMKVEHRRKLEEEIRSWGLSVNALRELFVERARHAREVRCQTFDCTSATDVGVVEAMVEERDDEVLPHVIEAGNIEEDSGSDENIDDESGDNEELAISGKMRPATPRPSSWKAIKLSREGIRQLSPDQLSCLWAAFIVWNDDTRQDEYEVLRDCLVTVLRKEKLVAELIIDSTAVPSEELVDVVKNRMRENGVVEELGVIGRIRQFLSAVQMDDGEGIS